VRGLPESCPCRPADSFATEGCVDRFRTTPCLSSGSTCSTSDRSRCRGQEIACGGGRGRTGTALACLAVLDGVPPRAAVAYVRKHYDPRSVETPSQRRYVTRFATS